MKESLNPGVVVHAFIPAVRRLSHTDLWIQGQSTELVSGQTSWGSKGVEKQKSDDNVIEKEMFQLQ